MSTIAWKYVKPLRTVSEAKELWKRYKIILPVELERCLLNNNGGRPSVFLFDTNGGKEYVFQSLFSYNKEDRSNIYNVYPGEFENTSLFPIGLEAAGNIICYDMSKKIYVLWNHESGKCENILL